MVTTTVPPGERLICLTCWYARMAAFMPVIASSIFVRYLSSVAVKDTSGLIAIFLVCRAASSPVKIDRIVTQITACAIITVTGLANGGRPVEVTAMRGVCK